MVDSCLANILLFINVSNRTTVAAVAPHYHLTSRNHPKARQASIQPNQSCLIFQPGSLAMEESIISSVFKKRAIWDPADPLRKNSKILTTLWEEAALEVGSDGKYS